MKISIITINYNNSIGLDATINSVINQFYTDYEYIVIDGGSSDNSIDVINEYSPRLACWVSEKDNGIYHAMNKGIDKASGEYLLFLNSGDYLEPNVLQQVASQLTGEGIVYGDLYYVSPNKPRELCRYPNSLSASLLISPHFSLPHPASFIKRELFENERYNEHYKIVSDWEFFLKSIVLKGCTTKHVPVAISNFLDGGISSKQENRELIMNEREHALSHIFPQMVYQSLQQLCILEQSPLCGVIPQIGSSRRFQRRMKRLILLLYKIHTWSHLKR